MAAYLRKNGAFETKIAFDSWVRVVCSVAVVVLIVCVSVSSYAYASESVLPNTPLYPVREVIERVEVTLAVTSVQKEKVEQKLVVRRQKEVQKLNELKRSVPVKLKKYLQATAATTTTQVLKKTGESKNQDNAQREKKIQETRKQVEERLQERFRLPKTKNDSVINASSTSIIREQRQHERQTMLQQRREMLEKKALQRQQEREAARQRTRTQRERQR